MKDFVSPGFRALGSVKELTVAFPDVLRVIPRKVLRRMIYWDLDYRNGVPVSK